MKFSIVTTVLNGAAFIGATIQSVLAQTHTDWDYVIIDAGSTDGTLDIVSRAASADSRITLKQDPGVGMYAAILGELSQSTGEMLSWINADDLYTPWAFERVVQHLIKDPGADWVTGLPAAWDQNGVLTLVRPQGLHPRALIRSGWFHGELLGFLQQESMFFSRALVEKLDRTEIHRIQAFDLAGDYALWRCLASHAPLRTIPSVLGGFRVHAGNRSVLEGEAYLAEVRRDGAVFLPWPLKPLVRRIYWLFAGEAVRAAATSAETADR
ncbi:MAG: glycosyltransferase [Pseudomonadota bacterium]